MLSLVRRRVFDPLPGLEWLLPLAAGMMGCLEEKTPQALQMMQLVTPGRLEFDDLGTIGLESRQVSGRMEWMVPPVLGKMELMGTQVLGTMQRGIEVFGMMVSKGHLILGVMELGCEIPGKM